MQGDDFKKRRESLGLTQEAIADELGVKRNTVYRWENNKLPISKTIELALQSVERKYVDDPILFRKSSADDDNNVAKG